MASLEEMTLEEVEKRNQEVRIRWLVWAWFMDIFGNDDVRATIEADKLESSKPN